MSDGTHAVAETLGRAPLGDFLHALGSKTPTPGGGAAAGVVGATGAALTRMVVAYSLGKKSLLEHQDLLEAANERLGRAESMFLRLAEEDAEAYGTLNALWKLPSQDPARAGFQEAVRMAIRVPMTTLALSVDGLRVCESLAGRSNRLLASDLRIGAIALESCARASECNVRVNLPSLDDGQEGGRIESQLVGLLRDATGCLNSVVSGGQD